MSSANKPKPNSITVRSALPTDLPSIHAIFTHYVATTTISFLVHPPTISYIQAPYEKTLARNLPYLVAVRAFPSNSNPHIDTNNSNTNIDNESEGHDELLGYASASPYRGDKLGYAATVEINIFVHPQCHHQGIGSALMTSLLDSLRVCTHKAWEEGYEDRAMGVSVRRVLAVMSMGGDEADRLRAERLREWYVGRWGFEEVGRLRGVGEKMGMRGIDTMYLMKEL